MLATKSVRVGLYAFALSCLCAGGLYGCGNGDTDGGKGNNDAGNGDPLVSDGGFGASLTLRVDDTTIALGDTTHFSVQILDPQGLPIVHTKVVCDTEGGLELLEPSANGIQNTNANGVMSGVVQGIDAGSFLLECRAGQGFNLIDATTIKVVGDLDDSTPDGAGGGTGGDGSTPPSDGTVASSSSAATS